MLAPGVTLSLTALSNGDSAGLCAAPFMVEKNILGQVADANVRAPRCGQCCGYINKYCDITNSRWICSLCGYRNVFSRQQSRYRNIDLRLLPELQDPVTEYRLPLSDGTGSLAAPISSRPLVHLFFVQESLRFDSLQAVSEAITAAALKLHPQVQIALVTFSRRIGVYRLSRYGATVQYLYLGSSGEGAAMPIKEVMHFMDACTEVALCRDSFCAAVSSLFDSSSDQSSHWQESDPDDEGAAMAVNSMLGPCLAAVGEWMLRPPYNISTSSSTDPFDAPGLGPDTKSAAGGLSSWNDDLLSFFGLGSAATGPADATDHNLDDENLSPASVCTGIFLHIFMDSSQGGLESEGDKSNLKLRHGIDGDSLRSLANEFAHRAVTVNIWAISNFGNDDLALSELEPLASMTGGHVNRCVLGLYPKDERIRLAESLCRTLNSTYATSGLLKVRSSSGLTQIPDEYSGPMVADKSFDGVFRLASCSPQTTIGWELHRNGSDCEHLCLQIAFTFETVVESELSVSDSADLCNDAPHLSESDVAGIAGSDDASHSAAPFTRSVLGILEMESGSQSVCFDRAGEYDCTRQLVVVKILRVVTVAWQVDSKLDTTVASALGRVDIPSTVALLTRRAVQRSSCYLDRREPSTTSSESPSPSRDGAESILKIINIDNPGIRYLLNWCVSFLGRLVEMQPREAADPFTAIVDSTMKIREVDELLRFVFAAVDLLTFHLQQDWPSADESAVFYSYCQRAAPSSLCALLYPQLFPLSRDLCVAARPIRLCRQAMVMDGAPYYLLDAATEVVVYQATLQDQRLPSSPPLPSMVRSVPPTASNSSTEQSAPSKSRKKIISTSKGPADGGNKKKQPLLVELGYRLTMENCPPEVRRASAGFASATSFDKYLIEDVSRSGISFPAFKTLLCSMVSIGEEKNL